MLRMYVGKRQQSWYKWLHMIKFAYNDHVHGNIGVSPLCILYGQQCRTLITLSTLTLDLKLLTI